MNTGRLDGERILKRLDHKWAAIGRFCVLALRFVNIVQVIVNNVRASSGARRYTE